MSLSINQPINKKWDCDFKSLECETIQSQILNFCDLCGAQACRNHSIHLRSSITVDKDIRVCHTCMEATNAENGLTAEKIRKDIDCNYKTFQYSRPSKAKR
jgi:hypothetical protein